MPEPASVLGGSRAPQRLDLCDRLAATTATDAAWTVALLRFLNILGPLVGGERVSTDLTSADRFADRHRQAIAAVPFGASYTTVWGRVVVATVLACPGVQVVGTATQLAMTVLLGRCGRVRDSVRVGGVEEHSVPQRIGLPLTWRGARRGLRLPGQLSGVSDREPVPAALVHLGAQGATGRSAGLVLLGALGGAFVKPGGDLGLVDSGHDGGSVPSGWYEGPLPDPRTAVLSLPRRPTSGKPRFPFLEGF